jgi:hypothetical protein
MSSRRINWLLRLPGFGALLVCVLLVAGVFSLDAVHPSHENSGHYHADGSHHHHRDDQQAADCAVCFFHSASATLDFAPAPFSQPQFVQVGDLPFPRSIDYAVVIVALWSGRAPPSLLVS